jgi:nucleoside-diphosphate-sugar epimerase
VPGIYASTRLPLERLKQRTPALVADEDVFTNHIHADDLARAIVATLYRGRPNRAYNACNDSDMKMGAWFDAVADAFRLPRPPRVTWEEAERRLAPLLLSFMSESRRLTNSRMKRELRVRLEYPTPQRLLQEIAPRDLKRQLALPL